MRECCIRDISDIIFYDLKTGEVALILEPLKISNEEENDNNG